MEMHDSLIVITMFTAFLVFFLSTSQQVSAQQDIEFNYVQGSGRGPEDWGGLKTEWAQCGDGEFQSPIDLLNGTVTLRSAKDQIHKNYLASNGTLINSGYDISVEFAMGSAGSVQINGTNYTLTEVHWHSPSEHTVHGRRYHLEQHLVHKSTNPDATIVIGQFFVIGRNDPLLTKLMGLIMEVSGVKEERQTEKIVPCEISPSCDQSYFHYSGSLTTPPCSQPVTWLVHKQVLTVSQAQIDLLQGAVNVTAMMNSRPLQ